MASALTPEQEAARATELARIEEVRADLERNYEAYASHAETAKSKLQALMDSGDTKVREAAKKLADEYELDVVKGGMKQPPRPKKHSPFAD